MCTCFVNNVEVQQCMAVRLMQSDCLYSSLLFEHYNRILLCGWVLRRNSVSL